MRVSLRITVLSGLYFTCLTLFPHIVFGQDGDNDDDRDRGRRESREDNGDDDGPRRGRGDFGDGRFGGPGGGVPWGGDGPRGGGPWGGRGGREGDGGPWGGGRDSWEGGGGRGPWGGRGGEEGGRRSRGGFGGGFGGFNPADLFARQDRNGDGQVSMDELDERSRGFMQRMAQNNGLSETGPWNIEEMRRSFEGRGGGDDRGDRGGRDRGDRDRDGGDRSESGDQPAANKSSVPGFGLASLEGAAGRLVPGFGIAASSGSEIDGDSNRTFGALARTNGRTSDGGGSRGGGSSSSSSSSAKPAASKAEADAQRMIKGNDANNDGKLQPDEMEGMFYKPKDPNNDGAVTLEELTAQLAKISGKSGDAKEEKSAAGGHSRGAGGDSSKKSMRFLTAKERLPDDIPDWFVDADEDEDGQVMMAEYAEHWTESVAKKFTGLDTDGDGVITPAEATSGRKSRDR